jgi:hypothetical protein
MTELEKTEHYTHKHTVELEKTEHYTHTCTHTVGLQRRRRRNITYAHIPVGLKE